MRGGANGMSEVDPSATHPATDQRLELTEEALKAAKFKGPVRYLDGRKGMAQQDFQCVLEPRFGYSWRRESRKEHGRQFYTVDGAEVPDLAEACKRLALPPDPDSPAEQMKRLFEEMEGSPQLNHGATRAGNFAKCNADASPFGTLRAWMQRSDNAWHGAINSLAEGKRGDDWPRWLYNTKHAFHETFRGMYLFAAEREKPTGLKCAMGKTCASCPILKTVEDSMVAARTRKPFPQELEDTDIDATKVATCIGHILTSNAEVTDGAFWSTKDSREDRW